MSIINPRSLNVHLFYIWLFFHKNVILPPPNSFTCFRAKFPPTGFKLRVNWTSPAFLHSICVSHLVQGGRRVVDMDRLRAFPGAHLRLRGDGRTAELLGSGLHGQDSQLGCVWISGTRFRPGRHTVPTAEQNQRHFRMLRVKRKGIQRNVIFYRKYILGQDNSTVVLLKKQPFPFLHVRISLLASLSHLSFFSSIMLNCFCFYLVLLRIWLHSHLMWPKEVQDVVFFLL